ncbi:hypothetical protein MTX38_32340 [Rhodococcus sp. ARC_M13]|uniref:hypothetical protein n=1 Tax=Rhodococcus sp. ARC_M13 TaxID=2928855 RepID=UPI0006D175FF|nr:hypothetical protein [Rhodococcus sp. ARC_M13]MCJ0901768.1 hypothetical protein [Rhodococcus sp. ARC_M13]
MTSTKGTPIMTITRTTCAAALLALTAATTLSACSSESPSALTIAMTATNNEPAPSTETIMDLLTEHAAGALDPEDGIVTLVTPDTTTTVDLTPMRGEAVEATDGKAEKKIAANIENLQQTASSVSSSHPGLDVLGVLDRALEATTSGGRVVLMSSGFATVDPIDLNAAGHWITAPEQFVDAIDDRNLPDAAGKNITFVGLGYPAPGSAQTVAGPAVRTALQTIMTSLCWRMDATACDVLPGPVSDLPPVSTTPVPVVELNQLSTQCAGQIDIDTSIAFAPESDVLLGGVDGVLAPIAQALNNCPGTTVVDAVGHSAAVPHESWGGGPDLETRRAQAVLTRLRDLGAPIAAIGTARPGGQIIDNMPGGNFREDLAVRNRVVTLTIN